MTLRDKIIEDVTVEVWGMECNAATLAERAVDIAIARLREALIGDEAVEAAERAFDGYLPNDRDFRAIITAALDAVTTD